MIRYRLQNIAYILYLILGLTWLLSWYSMLNFFVDGFLYQMIMLEGAKATTETVDALRTGASAMKAMQKAT